MPLGAIAVTMLLASAPANMSGPVQAAIARSAPPSATQAGPVSDKGQSSQRGTTQGAPSKSAQPVAEQAPDLIVVAPSLNAPDDPLAKVNVAVFSGAQKIDSLVFAPLAHGYKHDIPKPVRHGLRNFLNNLHEPVVFVNLLLQHRIGKAVETLCRFVINSTLGVGGLIDVAKRKPFNLPLRRNGFADTLGFYGVKPGAFLFLPIIGPTTVRDLIGGTLDRMMLPLTVGVPFSDPRFTVPTGVIRELDNRSLFDKQLKKIRSDGDAYVARRDFYFKKRRAEISGLHTRHTGILLWYTSQPETKQQLKKPAVTLAPPADAAPAKATAPIPAPPVSPLPADRARPAISSPPPF
ncbi:hypothetical protein GCM10023219_03010 [Stakelama sediminis]|uniref:Phospholipid-binding lipoprotein MlaA n=1 Tax=Stakelama sediminis TaxID=463200 RepID=A0A840YZV0_9SPHN|nr:VacJ family lipoprotein [Stakelama sediminis]MBB5719069.1 phospholipid-binding lipoprotein MlaA [Stakelama sediminis]